LVVRKKAVNSQLEARRERTAGAAWQPGDRVLASWVDGYFYPGRVRQAEGNSCEIAFDDGDVAWVHEANVRRPDIKCGSQVFCRFHAGPVYAPGIVEEQHGEKIQIRYENGDKEWTTISMVRVKHRLADVGGPPAQIRETQGDGPRPSLGGVPLMGGTMTMTATGPVVPPMGPAHIPDVGEPVADSNWRVGDRVLGRWFDFFWYPATILALGVKGYHLLFDDGDQRVVQDQGLMPLDVEEGEEIFIRPKSQPQRIYTPARVLRVDGESLDVELEDGTQESNQKISRARLWRCPVGVKSFLFADGDRVLAQDIDGFTYPGEILSVDHDKVIVHFLDGPERMLTPELIKPFDLNAGATVQCRWKGGQVYFSGKITQLDGDRVQIAYDDGDNEWTTVRLVRLL
jgi:hypothetical protein